MQNRFARTEFDALDSAANTRARSMMITTFITMTTHTRGASG
ncbi:MAG TPA: hypothetical protein VM711_00320 [Sphingomicrobium sp.]|nr:hypothetical protein [Sphingomicrobium sp.]